MQRLHDQLKEMNMGLAYDDFGAGQARLMELIEVKPDYVKFDIQLIRDLHKATRQHRQVVTMLVNMVRYLDVQTVAEGIECEEEAEVCCQMGFDFAQGFYFGKPQPLASHTSSRFSSSTSVQPH